MGHKFHIIQNSYRIASSQLEMKTTSPRLWYKWVKIDTNIFSLWYRRNTSRKKKSSPFSKNVFVYDRDEKPFHCVFLSLTEMNIFWWQLTAFIKDIDDKSIVAMFVSNSETLLWNRNQLFFVTNADECCFAWKIVSNREKFMQNGNCIILVSISNENIFHTIFVSNGDEKERPSLISSTMVRFETNGFSSLFRR